jgi:SAM-dependent methyltransferase
VSDDQPYVLGHSPAELRRLQSQAAVMDPLTGRYLVEAGLERGMRVLDVGSGVGDVAMLVGDLVGPDGEVVGFDRSAVAIDGARQRARARGLDHVRFLAGVVDELDLGDPYDAVVGRYVLQFQPDPAALLRSVAAHARPGGLVFCHELDWSGVASDPPAPTYERVRRWLQAAIESSGASAHMGLALPRVFVDAGLGDPVLRLEQRLGAGERADEVLERMAHLAGTLAPQLADQGIATPEELDVESLFQRMRDEVVASHSVVRSHLQVLGWTRV